MKVIFLDFDGVIIPGTYRWITGVTTFEPGTIQHLNRLIEETGAYIVVSSTLRYGYPTVELMQWLAEDGVKGKVISRTPFVDIRADRGDEIIQWLKDWRGERVEKFVILDDKPIDKLPKEHVQTDWYKGLTSEDVDKAVMILNGV